MATEPFASALAPMQQWPTSLLGRLRIVRADIKTSAKGFVAHALANRGSGKRPFYSSNANGQVLALCGQDEAFLALMNEADQIHADGMPMVKYSQHFSKRPLPERVAATDLIHAVAHEAAEAGVSFYFLGGSEKSNALAVENLKAANPKLVFAGHRPGHFTREEEAGIVEAINAAEPDILWIGLGVPLEQEFVHRNIDRLTGVSVIKTCGGLYDFLSGKNSRAPGWMQAAGLEWAYRAWLEPRRLGMRYLTTNPRAIKALFRHSAS